MAIPGGGKAIWDQLESGGTEHSDRELYHLAGGPALLEELAHRHLEQKPRNAQMLAILASSLDTGSLAVHGLGEAVALAVENDDVGVVDEPIREPNRSPAQRVRLGKEEQGSERSFRR